MNRPLKLFVIAGEASGDQLGRGLMAGLREVAGTEIDWAGVGGGGMRGEGLQSLFPMDELAVMGLAEVLPKARQLLARVRQTADAALDFAPDALITIDAPDFALRVAGRVKAARPGIRTIHYVAPSVWAWRPGRAKKMARVIDHVLALLPFEPPYMTAAGMSCDFVGHPAAAEPVPTQSEVLALRVGHRIGATDPVLLLLPGSRRGEISRLWPVFRDVALRLAAQQPDLRLMTVPAPGREAWLGEVFAGLPVTHVTGTEAERRAALAAATVALAASGTVSLELAAVGTPMVIAWAAHPLTAFLIKRMARVKSPTLVNLLTDSFVVPDFLFENCRADLIAPAVARLMDDPIAIRAQREAGAEAMRMLGRGDEAPGLRAARSVLAAIR